MTTRRKLIKLFYFFPLLFPFIKQRRPAASGIPILPVPIELIKKFKTLVIINDDKGATRRTIMIKSTPVRFEFQKKLNDRRLELLLLLIG